MKKFNFNKVITWKDKKKAKIGKEYYFFNNIDPISILNYEQGKTLFLYKSELTNVYDDRILSPFYCNRGSYSFLYPVD